MIQNNKIHIDALQETHIMRNYNYQYNDYSIITSAALQETPKQIDPTKGIQTAGVAIRIHEELEHHITNIIRIDG